MDHDHEDNLSLYAQSLPFNITQNKITPLIQRRQSLKPCDTCFQPPFIGAMLPTFPLYCCPLIDDETIYFCFRRDESDPVRALNLREGGICPEPDLCVLRACHQRRAHSLVLTLKPERLLFKKPVFPLNEKITKPRLVN